MYILPFFRYAPLPLLKYPLSHLPIHPFDTPFTQVLSWEEAQNQDRQARKEVEKILQLNKIMPPGNLLDPGGSFKPALRTTVLDSLLTTR